MKDMGEADVILGIRIIHESNGILISQSHYIKKAVSQLEYSRVIGCLMYAMTCTRLDIAFVVGKLSRGGAILRASRKQTCITSATMEYEFMALVAAGKEVEWLKNLILEIPLWFKPITPISICCDSDATLAKAYSQMYNGKEFTEYAMTLRFERKTLSKENSLNLPDQAVEYSTIKWETGGLDDGVAASFQ
ncbi:hypothetical protein Tco_0440145 [Tanacetum coccineum]